MPANAEGSHKKIRSGLLSVFFEDYTITHVKAVTAFTTRTFNSFSSVNFYPYASIYFGILDFMDDDMYYIYILHITNSPQSMKSLPELKL